MKALTPEQKNVAGQLKARLWLAIGQIVDEEASLIEGPRPVTATPQFVASLVELVYNQAISLGEDLESFARHAKRKTITPEDLLMVTRRNPDLTVLLQEFWQELNGGPIANDEGGEEEQGQEE